MALKDEDRKKGKTKKKTKTSKRPAKRRAKRRSNAFWRFSLKVYAKQGVAPACLALQDRHGLDVNLLLCCAWAGSNGRAFNRADLEDLGGAVGDWHREAVRPLRAVRRWMKAQDAVPARRYATLREEVKRLELDAEQLEQEILFETLALKPAKGSPLIVAANLRLYLEILGVEPAVTDVADLAALLAGAYPEVPPLEAVWLFAE